MGTISNRKPNHLLIGALEPKFQVLSQHPQKFFTEGFFCSSSCAQLVFALYLLMLRDFLIVKSSVIYIVGSYQQNERGEIIQSYRVRITSMPTFSATNVQRQNTEYMKQRLQNS